MKKRIEQLLNGIFEYEPAKLTVLPEKIEQECMKGSVIHGSFRIESEDGRKIKGFLYSPSPRITCSPVEFQGITNDIHYQIDCSGMEEGMEESGVLTICSDHGEDTIPYSFCIRKKERQDTDYKVESVAELTALAREDFQKAYRCFLAEDFRRLLKEKEKNCLGLYDSLGIPSFSYESLEAFLVDCGQKEAIEISVSQKRLDYPELTEPIRETVTISKNTWGFQKITIESDAGFVRPEKKVITTDEFAGSTFDLHLVLDSNLMHAGKNYARVRLSTPLQRVDLEITASRFRSQASGRQEHICKIMQKELEALYVGFRLKKIDMNTWTERSADVINSYKRSGGKDVFADLFQVQLYFAEGKKQKALKLLETIETQKSRLNTPERYGYCLYMSTFFYQESAYVDRVEEEISRLFYRDKTNWKLQWILLYLRESLLNDENAKYEAVAEQFRYGCRSRIMYLEAWQILKKNPFLMRSITEFELHLLRFAVKEEVLTAQIMRQAANLTMHQDNFSQPLFEVLAAGYEQYPSTELVKAICTLLMKGGKKEKEYFVWYAKGVESGLRITGLYEYYMETMDCLDLQKMPQIIRMYFAYDTTLDYRRRAAIYRRIIDNRESDPQTYYNYRAAIEKFALDQLESMRITEDLGVIYHKFLRRNILTQSGAEKLTRLLFTYEVTCTDPQMKKVIIHSTRIAQEQYSVLIDGCARIQVYDPQSIILVEDDRGCRYQASMFCEIRRVFESEEMMEWCAQKVPQFPGLVLSICAGCLQEGIMNRKTLPYFRTACEIEEFDREFREEIKAEVLHYYLEHPRDESLVEFLDSIHNLDYVQVDKTALIVLLAEEGRCQEAFVLLDAYGAEGIPLMRLVRICSRMVLDLEFEENTMLVSLCYSCFKQGKYDDKLLRYLLLYYEGPAEEMIQVWSAAQKFELDTMILEEKIMMMLLFTRSGTQGSEPVFEAYLAKMGRRKLCRAYVNLKAYEYFVKGVPVAESVFRFMEKEYAYLNGKQRLMEQEEICRLALLRYYSRAIKLEPSQRVYAGELLEEFGAKGMRFAFWQRFDQELLAPYQMEGRVFAEYVTNPAHTVNIYYRMAGKEEEYTKETVKNYFGGIFVKEFTLFYGEELECYLEEDNGQECKKTDKRILRAPESSGEGTSRYQMLNQISKEVENGETQKAREEIESYLLLEYLAKELFTLV